MQTVRVFQLRALTQYSETRTDLRCGQPCVLTTMSRSVQGSSLRVAAQLEPAAPWRDRTPPTD